MSVIRNRFRVSSLLASRLTELGVALPALLQRAGLPAEFFRQEKITASTDELFAMWRAIGEATGDPGIGLKLGSESRLERFDPSAIAALCSQSFLEGWPRMGTTVARTWYSLILSMVLCLPQAGAQVTARVDKSSREFVDSFYQWYVPRTHSNLPDGFWDSALRYKRSAFSAELFGLLKENADAQARCHDLVGLDFDPFLTTRNRRSATWWAELLKRGKPTRRISMRSGLASRARNRMSPRSL